MAMQEVLDGVRRIVYKWVNTISPLSSSVSVGDRNINVEASRRFEPGDQVMIKNDLIAETGLIVESVPNDTTVTLVDGVLNNWELDTNPSGGTISNSTVLIKTINNLFVQGIYIGSPDVIARYPAITVNGASRSSEWMTLESTKERYEIEITVYVQAAMHEKGYRFMMEITDVIQKGLKRNLVPLINDYDVTSLVSDVSIGDVNISINNNTESIGPYRRILLENNFNVQENWIDHIHDVDPSGSVAYVHLHDLLCYDFSADNTSVIIPKRFAFNSWPAEIDYGSIHKGELLKASVIRWFAEEEEMQYFRRDELPLK